MVKRTYHSCNGNTSHPAPCSYRAESCPNQRAVKSDEHLHALCETHRTQANKRLRTSEPGKKNSTATAEPTRCPPKPVGRLLDSEQPTQSGARAERPSVLCDSRHQFGPTIVPDAVEDVTPLGDDFMVLMDDIPPAVAVELIARSIEEGDSSLLGITFPADVSSATALDRFPDDSRWLGHVVRSHEALPDTGPTSDEQIRDGSVETLTVLAVVDISEESTNDLVELGHLDGVDSFTYYWPDEE